MLRIKFTYVDILNPDNPLNAQSPFYYATEALDYDNIFWEGRITDSFEIERFFEMESDTTNRIRSMSVTLDNHDKYFNQFVSDGKTLINNQMTLYYNDASNVTKTFTGTIISIDSFGTVITLTLREIGYDYLENNFPDAQIAYDYYSESGINDSWNCIPIHFGTVKRIPLSWVNSLMSEYMIGSGPILSVDKVYIDKEVIYDINDPNIHYKPSDDSKEIHVRIFRGTGYDADGQREYVDDEYHYEDEEPISGNLYRHTSNWGGFAYIQLFSVNDDGFETPAYPYTTEGGLGQVYVDIRGIVEVTKINGNYVYGTEMVRNPAKIIKMMFCNREFVSEAPCAIGWGYSEDDVDFAEAILDCENFGFKIDGSFDSTQVFSEALKEILHCCRGYIIEDNNLITLHIDKFHSASDIRFDEEGIYGFDCTLDEWSEDDLESHVNRIRLSYDWSQEYSKYSKKPSANHESPDWTEDSEIDYDECLKDFNDVMKIQKWNPEDVEFKMVSDCTTAHRLAAYYLRKKSMQHIRGKLTCPNVASSNLDAGDVITIRSPQFDWYGVDSVTGDVDTDSGKLFQITNISKGEEYTTIEFIEYSNDIFYYDSHNFDGSTRPQGVPSKLLAKTPLNVVCTADYYDYNQTSQCYIDGVITYDKTGQNYVTVIQIADCGTEGTTPDEGDFTTVMTIDGKNTEFRIENLQPAHIYVVRVYTKDNSYRASSPFTTSPVTMVGDLIPPPVPTVVGSVYLKTANFDITIGDYPDDLMGFEIWRNDILDTIDNPGTQIGVCYAQNGIGSFTDENVPQYDTNYYYRVRAYDRWGNYSDFTDPAIELSCPKVQVADVTHDWIVSNIFETAINVGESVDGVRFTANGIQGWHDGLNIFNLNATGPSAIGGWRIDFDKLTNEKIEINSNGMIRTSDFVSGHNGWTINEEGSAEFMNVNVRGIVKTAVFEKDRISAVGGYELIRPASVSTLTGSGEFVDFEYLVSESTYTVEQATLQHEYVLADLDALMGDGEHSLEPYDTDMTYEQYQDIEYEAAELAAELMGYTINDDGKKIFVADNSEFAVDDIVRIKNGVTNDVWARVKSKGSNAYRGNYLNLETASGIWFDPEAGQSVVNYGNAGSGGILLDGNSPLIDMFTHDGEPWNGVNTCVRIGNLNGINGIYTNTHGFFVGDPDTSHDSTPTPRHYIQYDEDSGELVIQGIVKIKNGNSFYGANDISNVIAQAGSAVNTANQASAQAANAVAMANGMIKSADIYYYVSDSEKELTGGTWQTSQPEWNAHKFIWTKTVYTLQDGVTKTESSAVCISGKRGPAGESGITIVNLKELYYCSDSASQPQIPTPEECPVIETGDVYNQWTQNCPTWTSTYRYYYTCTEIHYSDDTYVCTGSANERGIQIANENAENAQETADEAQTRLDEYADDNMIAPGEKEALYNQYKNIVNEYNEIITEAGLYNINYADYTNAYNLASRAYRYFCDIENPDSPSEIHIAWDVTIKLDDSVMFPNARQYYNNIINYYNVRKLLQNSISQSVKANTDEAHSRLDEYAADNMIAPGEKEALYHQYQNIINEYNEIITEAGLYNINYTSYTTAYNLASRAYRYFCDIENPEYPSEIHIAWDVTIKLDDSVMFPNARQYYNNIINYYNVRKLLQNSISQSVKATADSAYSKGEAAYNLTAFHYGTCSTASGTAKKVVVLSNTLGQGTFPTTLWAGCSIRVKFNNANTVANPTIEISGTSVGVKTIQINGSALNSQSYYWRANDVVEFVFDGTYWQMTNLPKIGTIFYPGETTINGGLLKTRTVNADSIVSNSITTNELNTNAIKSINYKGGSDTCDSYSTEGSFFNLANGCIVSKKFLIKSNGDAFFAGDISAASGTFKGSLQISSGSYACYIDSSNGIKVTYGGATKFQVTNTGNITLAGSITASGQLTASDANITGGSIKITSGSNYIQLNNSTGLSMYTGSTKKFGVDMNGNITLAGNITASGKLVASNAEINGKITTDSLTATAGTIGGVSINSGMLNGLTVTNIKGILFQSGYSTFGQEYWVRITFPIAFDEIPDIITCPTGRETWLQYRNVTTTGFEGYIRNAAGGYWLACGYKKS